MTLALAEARKGEGQTSPNPSVGAVIVCEEEVVGRGYHVKAGTPHAERNAIADARAQGFTQWSAATLYCTLEPCSTPGRTGACSDAIIESGIGRVVYASQDANPQHAGRVDGILREHDITVSSGVCQSEADSLIRGFTKRQELGLPWVIVKSAMSLDGKISRPAGEGQWLTSPESRTEVHRLRAEVDAIITGGNTVRTDNPSLSVRLEGRDPTLRQPLRVVLTQNKSALPAEAELLRDPATLVYETAGESGLEQVIRSLGSEHGVNTVLVEAGGGLLGSFCDAGLVDEVVMFYAPMITGGEAQAVAGIGASTLDSTIELCQVRYQQIGHDVMMRGINRDSDLS